MKKIITGILLLVVILIGAGFLYLVNPNDKHYIAFQKEESGWNSYKQKDFNKYFEYIDNPVTLTSHYAPSYILSKVYALSGRYNDAIRVIKTFDGKDVSYGTCITFDNLFQRAFCRLTSDEHYIESFDKEFEISKIYFAKRDYDKAFEHYQNTEKVDSCYFSKIYSAKGDFKNAKSTLNECESYYNHKRYKATRNIANGYYEFKKKNYKAAEKLFNDSISKSCEKLESCNGNNDIYLLLGELYQEQGQYKKALSYYDRILKNEPYTYWANRFAYEASLKIGKKKEASKYLENIVKYNSDNKSEIEKMIKKNS